MVKEEIIDFINSSNNLTELKEIRVELEKRINKLDSDYHPSISSLFVEEEPSESELYELANERSKHVHYTWVQNGHLCDDDGIVLEKDW